MFGLNCFISSSSCRHIPKAKFYRLACLCPNHFRNCIGDEHKIERVNDSFLGRCSIIIRKQILNLDALVT